MALTRKPGPAQTVSLIGEIPVPPDVPSDVLDRFDSMAQWQSEFKDWWNRFSDMLQRDRSQVQAQFQKDESQEASDVAALRASVTTLTDQVNALSAGGTVTQTQFNALSATVSDINATLTQHVLATIAHGTTGDIVGTTDAQNLDQKVIGSTFPKYGRFAPAVGVNRIGVGQVVNLGPTDFMVVAGTLEVAGTLTIAGTLVTL